MWADDIPAWAEAYERRLDDFLGLQAEIAGEVASRLDLSLRQTERRALEAEGTEVPAAYFAYLRGLDHLNQPQFSQQRWKTAASMFERAIEQDPTFVEAYTALCRVLPTFISIGISLRLAVLRRKMPCEVPRPLMQTLSRFA